MIFRDLSLTPLCCLSCEQAPTCHSSPIISMQAVKDRFIVTASHGATQYIDIGEIFLSRYSQYFIWIFFIILISLFRGWNSTILWQQYFERFSLLWISCWSFSLYVCPRIVSIKAASFAIVICKTNGSKWKYIKRSLKPLQKIFLLYMFSSFYHILNDMGLGLSLTNIYIRPSS